jgi:hypothetical protein
MMIQIATVKNMIYIILQDDFKCLILDLVSIFRSIHVDT